VIRAVTPSPPSDSFSTRPRMAMVPLLGATQARAIGQVAQVSGDRAKRETYPLLPQRSCAAS
jgi:hypothetical protein